MATSEEVEYSVLMPVYLPNASFRQAILVREAVNSIVRQGRRRRGELLLIDDGSPFDIDSLGLARLLRGAPIEYRYVRLARNRGLVYALNHGLQLSRGTYVARLDCDDVWLDTKLDTQLGAFEQDGNLTLSGTSMRMCDPLGRLISEHNRSGGWQNVLRFALEVGTPFPHSSVVGLRSIFKRLGGYSFEPSHRHVEDYELWTRWSRYFKAAFCDAILLRYTVHEHSVSVANSEEQRARAGAIHAALLANGGYVRSAEIVMAIAERTGAGLIAVGCYLHELANALRPSFLPASIADLVREFMGDADLVRLEVCAEPPAALPPFEPAFGGPGEIVRRIPRLLVKRRLQATA